MRPMFLNNSGEEIIGLFDTSSAKVSEQSYIGAASGEIVQFD